MMPFEADPSVPTAAALLSHVTHIGLALFDGRPLVRVHPHAVVEVGPAGEGHAKEYGVKHGGECPLVGVHISHLS